MQNYKFIFLFLDLTESEASVTDAYDLDGSLAVITEDMEKEAPPAKEPGKQIIIGKKFPFLFPLQGLKCRTTLIFLFLDSTESEASVTDEYALDSSSAGVKSVITEEEKTGASQQYDPLTMPSLPGMPGNILIQFLAFVLFYWCLGLLLCVVIYASF